MAEQPTADVVIVGGGVAGQVAGMFVARHGFDTAILSSGSPLLRRNAHLENFPGFPAGINARLLLRLMSEQAERAGCRFVDAEVTRLDSGDEGFTVHTASGSRWSSEYVIAATKNEVSYLEHLEDVEILDRGKLFVATDGEGRTDVEGLYIAGRMARKPHQAIVAAGHGAEVAVRLLEDDETPFYRDWVAPERYFTGRDREVPPGCEEIDRAEQRRREQEAIETMAPYFEEPYPEPPEQHPSVDEDS